MAEQRCRSCGAPVEWRKTATGKWCPYDAGTETSHFQTCPDAKRWSKRIDRLTKAAPGER